MSTMEIEDSTSMIESDDDYLEVLSQYDSCYSSGSDATTSIASEVTNFRFEHGRRYHAYSAGKYWGPNDEQQNEQLEIFHQIYYRLLEGLYLVPLPGSPKHVLDLGTGTGIWAIQFAEDHPTSDVLGIDLSPVQPAWVPANCNFEVDDFTKPWVYPPQSFDFIHARDLHGSVEDWPTFFDEAYNALTPGGWYESAELELGLFSENYENGDIPEEHVLSRWWRYGGEAAKRSGRRLDVAGTVGGLMRRRGFTEVQERVYKVPIGPWPKDARLKLLGKWNLLNFLEGADGFCLALFTRYLNMPVQEVKDMIEEVKKCFMDSKMRLYSRIHVTYGKRPESDTTWGNSMTTDIDSAYYSASNMSMNSVVPELQGV